jgi:hypothetical protein
MGFLSPWFLAGLAAVGVPLYLHLLRRHTINARPFSSLMFFEARTQSSVRQQRLRYLLLLSLRMALLILLALTFANPYLHRSAANIPGEKLLLLVIDNSFSMRAGSRLADARQQALSVLASRTPAELGQVMTLGSQIHVLTQPTEDSAELRSAISNIGPGDTHGSFSNLAQSMRSLSENVHTPIELHVFSDMQKSKMPTSFAELVLPSNVSLFLHPVVKETAPNWTVESVDAPGQVWDPKKVRVQAVIAGYNTPAASRTVSLVVNGKTTATRAVMVPANGRATVEFQSLEVPYGFSRCEVKIDSADSFAADDSSLFAVQRSDPENVLFVHEASDSRSPVYFGAALAASADAAFALQSLPVEQAANIQPSKYAFIVLSEVLSLPPSLENELLKYVRSGGSVFIAAGTSTGHHARIPLVGNNVLESRSYAREGDAFRTVGETDPAHPSMDKSARWAGVKFYYVVRVEPGDARVIARLTDLTPLLLEDKIGEGRVLVLTSGLDNLTNDFPLHPVFVPFVEQTARYLSGTERRSGSRLVDTFLELRTAKEQAVSVEVVDPDGRKPLSIKEATTAQSYQLTRAGFYQLRLADGREDLIGVNADRRESDLSVIPADVLSLWGGNTNSDPQQTPQSGQEKEAEKPYSIWWYAMLLVFATAVAESLLASRYLGTQREEQ